MSPSRAVAAGLAGTRNSTCPVPCPEAGATPAIQFASDDAVHEHSGVVVTITVPVPPVRSSAVGEVASVMAHLVDEGAVVVVSDEEHAVAVNPTLSANATAAVRNRTHFIGTSNRPSF